SAQLVFQSGISQQSAMPLVRSSQSAVDSSSDGMPGGLELDKVPNLVDALCFGVHPVEPVLALARTNSFDALGRAELELLLFFRIDDGAQTTDVSVCRERWHQLLSEPREDVHYSARKIINREQLAKRDGGIGKLLRGQANAGVAGNYYGRDLAQEPEQRELIVGDDANDTHGLGHREIEERACHRIGVAEHLLVFVRPARGVNEPIDAG